MVDRAGKEVLQEGRQSRGERSATLEAGQSGLWENVIKVIAQVDPEAFASSEDGEDSRETRGQCERSCMDELTEAMRVGRREEWRRVCGSSTPERITM